MVTVDRGCGQQLHRQPAGGRSVTPTEPALMSRRSRRVPATVRPFTSTTLATRRVLLAFLDPGDTITIMFSEDVQRLGSGDTFTVIDVDGSTAQLVTRGPTPLALIPRRGTDHFDHHGRLDDDRWLRVAFPVRRRSTQSRGLTTDDLTVLRSSTAVGAIERSPASRQSTSCPDLRSAN